MYSYDPSIYGFKNPSPYTVVHSQLLLAIYYLILPNPSRETKFSGANADREILIFPAQLTTSRVVNLTWLIHTLAVCVTTYIPTSSVVSFCSVLGSRVLLFRNDNNNAILA